MNRFEILRIATYLPKTRKKNKNLNMRKTGKSINHNKHMKAQALLCLVDV